MRKLKLFVMMLALTVFLAADEGMWLLNQLQQLNLAEKGIKIDVSQIYSPGKPCLAQAIVNLGGGTGELVSADGLMLTNHHVAYGAIQRASAKLKETDLIASGFLARTRKDEIEAPGYSAMILEKMEDVTAQFKEYSKITDPEKRQRAIDKKIREISDAYEKGRKDTVASVSEMLEGLQYILFVYKRYDDVRVVYVPADAIGEFGGEVDNWMWPRHTGDFSFLRVYTAPDGSGREYDPNNIPYKSKYWLKTASTPLRDGDMTFIMGFPGRTNRYKTASTVDFYFNYSYPKSIHAYQESTAILEKLARESVTAHMKVASRIKRNNNGMKKYQGMIQPGAKSILLERKKIEEAEVLKFLESRPELKKKFGHVVPALEKEYITRREIYDRQKAIDLFSEGTLLDTAISVCRIVKEREKPARERNPRFSEKDSRREFDRLEFKYISFYEPLDIVMLQRAVQKYQKMPQEKRIARLDELLGQWDPDNTGAWIAEAIKNSKFREVEFVKGIYKKTGKDLSNLDEPIMKIALALYPEQELLRKENERFEANVSVLDQEYIRLLVAWKGKTLYPDANSTLRFTYGPVRGYQARDAVYYSPFTTIAGVLEKDTGETPFIVPGLLKDLFGRQDFGQWKDPKLGDVPVAFLHECDITGGNSGSPALNANGEIVGIAFDGNWEAMTSDWLYQPEKQRTISVDMRYVLFVTEKFARANHILEEMGVPLSK